MLDVGVRSRTAMVVSTSTFYRRIDNGSLKLPNETKFPILDVIPPIVFIGFEAFPLRNYLMILFSWKR